MLYDMEYLSTLKHAVSTQRTTQTQNWRQKSSSSWDKELGKIYNILNIW